MKNSILLRKEGKVAKTTLGLFLFLFTFLLSVNLLDAQDCSLVAEDEISAAVDQNCQATITFDAVLDGTMTSCPLGIFEVFVYDGLTLVASGNPAIVPAGYVGESLTTYVKDNTSGNRSNDCILNIFDNFAPTLACFEPAEELLGDIAVTDPVYQRTRLPIPPCNLSGPGNAVNYDVFEFAVSADDTYEFALASGGVVSPNGYYVAIYEEIFDPLDACTNFVGGASGDPAVASVDLEAGLTYFLVTSGRLNGNIGDYAYTFSSLAGGAILVEKPDCIYNLYSYQNVDEEVFVLGEDNCDSPVVEVVQENAVENNCALGWAPELLRMITRTYKGSDLSVPANESALLDVEINVFKIPDPIYYNNILGPIDFTVIGGNPISCDADFTSTLGGCCTETGFPIPADVGDELNPGAPFLEIEGVMTSLVSPDVQNNLSATYIDMVITTANPSCVRKVMRMWTVTEWGCVERIPRVFFQEIEVADITAPVIECPDNELVTTNTTGTFENTSFGTVNCGAAYTFPIPFTDDNCQSDLEWNINVTNDNGVPVMFLPDVSLVSSVTVELPLGVNTILYTLNDGCGNVADCSFEVEVKDNTPPVAICQTFTTVALTYDGEAEVPATSFDSGSYDDCQFKEVKVRRMEESPDDYFDYVTFTCADVGVEGLMVVMRAYDIFDNWSECMVSVEVQDKLNPTIEAPADMFVDCEFFYEPDSLSKYFGVPTAYDNCNYTITQDSTTEVFDCWDFVVKRITRNFTATDDDGRTATDTQIIEFQKLNYFGFDASMTSEDALGAIVWPEDVEYTTCLASDNAADPASPLHPNQTGRPSFTELPCDEVGFTYSDFVFVDNDDDLDNNEACFKIIRTWLVMDNCHRENGSFVTWTYDQVIFVKNGVAPVIDATPDLVQPTFDVDCVDGEITLEYGASDDCTPDEDLRWAYYVDLDNDNALNVWDDQSLVFAGADLNASGVYPIGTHKILWLVWDQCGNRTIQEQLITIMNAKKPTPICLVGLSTDVTTMPQGPTAMINAEFYNDNSNHTCDYPLAFSYTADYTDNVRTYGCNDIGFHDIEMWVTAFLPDGSIQQDYCTTEIEIQDNFDLCPNPLVYVEVSGGVRDEMENPVSGVSVALDGSEFNDQVSDDSGSFEFPQMLAGGNYEVRPEMNTNHANGVSTLDLIHVQKHLLGLRAIDSPYKMIAADVNKDQKLSAADLLNTRELILGVTDQFEHNQSWRFVQANYIFENEANPLTEAIPESDLISNIQEDINTNFIAIKVGDITNDASLNGLPVVESRNLESLQLDIDAVKVNIGQVEIPVYANAFNNINGFQFTLNFEQNALSFKGIESGALSINQSNYFDIATKGKVTVSWSKAVATDVADDVVLFTMLFDAERNVSLEDALNIGSALTRAEAYDANLNKMDLELNFRNLEMEGEYALYQNTPNPFSEITQITFNMKEAGYASIAFFDLNGKVVKIVEGEFNKGMNQMSIGKNELPVNGMLYYQLNTDGFSATKKMILLK